MLSQEYGEFQACLELHNKTLSQAGKMAQVIVCLLSKCEALDSVPHPKKTVSKQKVGVY
jgi:hypothetical protein